MSEIFPNPAAQTSQRTTGRSISNNFFSSSSEAVLLRSRGRTRTGQGSWAASLLQALFPAGDGPDLVDVVVLGGDLAGVLPA